MSASMPFLWFCYAFVVLWDWLFLSHLLWVWCFGIWSDFQVSGFYMRSLVSATRSKGRVKLRSKKRTWSKGASNSFALALVGWASVMFHAVWMLLFWCHWNVSLALLWCWMWKPNNYTLLGHYRMASEAHNFQFWMYICELQQNSLSSKCNRIIWYSLLFQLQFCWAVRTACRRCRWLGRASEITSTEMLLTVPVSFWPVV